MYSCARHANAAGVIANQSKEICADLRDFVVVQVNNGLLVNPQVLLKPLLSLHRNNLEILTSETEESSMCDIYFNYAVSMLHLLKQASRWKAPFVKLTSQA